MRSRSLFSLIYTNREPGTSGKISGQLGGGNSNTSGIGSVRVSAQGLNKFLIVSVNFDRIVTVNIHWQMSGCDFFIVVVVFFC